MPTLAVTPATVAVGGSFVAAGSGYGSRRTVTLYFGTATVASFRSTRAGAFSRTLTAPGATALVKASSSAGSATATLTVTAPVVVPPPPTPPPPSPPPPTTGMLVALTMARWNVPAEAKAAVDVVTVATSNGATTPDNGSLIAAYAAGGLQVISVLVGPYSAGVQALNAASWAANAVASYNAHPCLAIEILNEPAGSWFWGSGAESSANAAAYGRLLKAVRDAFATNGSKPKLLASFDGGYSGSIAWGQAVMAADPLAYSYVDGITVHPYGGTGTVASSALGNRANVAAAHTASGNKPVYITELGWPTAVGQPATGDSLQWSEADQATNITNFITWARAQGYIAAVTIFQYQDFSTNYWYGVTRVGGAHKPSFEALRLAAHP